MLSHHSTGEQVTGAPSSKRRVHSHLVSAVALARALYSTSVLDRATVYCFLQPQEMRLSPRNTQMPQLNDDYRGIQPNPCQRKLEEREILIASTVNQSEWFA